MYNYLITKKCTAILIFAIFIGLSVSCSGADPVIYDFDWTLQVSRNIETNAFENERLILQILADDDDGFNEIYEIYLMNDDAQMYWRVTSDEWTLLNKNNVNWIGINSIYSDDYKKIPRGNYRLLLRDLSGYEDEKTFSMFYDDFTYSSKDIPRLIEKEKYVFSPIFSEDTTINEDNSRVIQLTYPNTESILDLDTLYSRQNKVQYLGNNNTLYTINADDDIYIMMSTDSTEYDSIPFSMYIHYIKAPHLLLSSGPYKIE